MEVPVINRLIPELESVHILPSLLSHFLSNFQVTQTYIFFKWGALFLALVASFTALIKNTHLNKYQTHPSSQQPLLLRQVTTEEEDFSDSESVSDSEETTASSSSYSDAHEDEDFILKGNFKDRWQIGNFSLRRRRRNGSVLDLSSLITGPVVNMWDNSNLSSLFAPNVAVSAERNLLSGRFLKVWDTRMGGWSPRFGVGDVVKVSGTGGVFVRDDVTGVLTVGDVRKLGMPLLDADVDAWLNADAVIANPFS